MAELVATKLAEALLSQVVERITELLIHEAASLRGVGNDVEELRNELRWIKSFLKDADQKQEQDERVRLWITEVRDVASEIEDSIEIYIFKVRSSYIKLFHLRELRTKLSTIENKLRSIRERRQTYGIQFGSGDQGTNSLRNLRRSYPDDEEDDIIMLKDTMAALKTQLMALENRRRVVSVVGMGGLGKTTLAKKVYNDDDVKKHFDCCAWVFVSQQYVMKEHLSEILIQVGFQSDHPNIRNFEKQRYTKESLEERKSKRELLNSLNDHELICLTKNELEEKRYLIVLDDIWRIDAWQSVQSAFPNGKSGSKVMFTTRIETIASSADPLSPPIRPPLLTPSESWELLKRKAIPRETLGEHVVPFELEEVGKTTAEKCGGLPLAIIVLGGFLRTKINSVDECVKVLKDVKTRMINKMNLTQQYRVEDILDLSFQDLPYFLKPCFLYLGRFPEDSEIPKGRLIRLWIAEGFMPTVGRIDIAEDIAEQYLGELIDRCMVQVSKKDKTGKGVKTFRLHDLMRDFCISKAKEELFLEIVQPSEANQIATAARSRRIAIHMNHDLDGHTPWAGQVHSNLRSLVCSVPILSLKKENFLLLRVLELDCQQRDGACKLPGGIGNLIYLRYLKLCATTELILPKSIGNLLLLQTLDLLDVPMVLLPSTMSRLRHLRHLLLPYYYLRHRWAMGAIAFGNDSLKKIVTLKGIKAKHLIRDNEVLPLCNIRVLEIRGFRSDKEVTLVLNSLSFHSQLGSLQSLGMHFQDDGEFPNLELLSHCHVLSKLSLEGQLSQENFGFLPKSLTKFHLSSCLCDQDKIAVLEKIPNLRILQWWHGYRNDVGYKLVFSDGGFPKLEILRLCYFPNFVEWEVEEGAMPNLKRLDIEDIRQLRMIPEGLKHVTTLRELNVSGMPKEFEERLRASEGEDFYKVSHIPSVSISNTLK